MMSLPISKQLGLKGMPVFWQFYTFLALLLAIVIFFIKEENWLYTTSIALHFISFIGVVAGYRYHKQRSYPRLLLVNGAGLIIIAKVLQSLIIIGLPIYPNIPLLVEEQGIILITVFAFIHMMMLEKKFNIKGITIDYSLLVASCSFFFLLVSPNILNTFIYELSFYQQLLILNIYIGLTLLSMAIFHYFMTKAMSLTDSVRIVLTILLITHFSLDLLMTFEDTTNLAITNGLSLSSYHLAGAIAIVFLFTEKLSTDYSPFSPSRIGSQFMWIASITAIVSIPLALIIRSFLNVPPINSLIIGILGALLSIIVIWRFIILIKNANHQRQQLNNLIKTNALTNTPNYQGYLEFLTLSNIPKILVININIDDFKSINDLYGRDVADDILKNLATRLKELSDILLVAHTHSDMFLVVFQTEESNINNIINKIQEDLGVWDTVQGKQLTVPLSYGASYSAKAVANPEKLAKQAEQALKEARNQHTTYSLYIDKRENNSLPRHEIRDILQQSVDHNFLPVHFQPIYNLEDGSLKALELLIRVESKDHGLLLPGQFLDQAKSYGLLTSLTKVCIRMIAKHYADLPNVVININLPPYMLKSQKLLNNFIFLFEEENLPPERFCIEITEDENIPTTELISAVAQLKDYGFTIAMDDFGTGYSSLDRLSVLAVDTVKIDRSLLLTASSGNTAILEWAILLAKRLGICAVVEGVETKEQLSLVKLLGADSVQGFLYSRPIPALQAYHIPLNSNDISIS